MFQPSLTFAIAGQQGRFLTAWAAWQLVELFCGRKTIALGLFVHDLRCWLTIAWATNGRLLTSRLIVARRPTVARLFFATGLTIAS